MSLRARLVLGMAVIAAVLALSAVVITTTTRAHLVDQVDQQLREARPQLRGLSAGAQDPPPPASSPTPRLSDLYVGSVDVRGVLRTIHAPDLTGGIAPRPILRPDDVRRLRAGQAVTVGSDDPGANYRLLPRGEGPRGAIGVLGLELDDVDSAIRRLIAVEAVAVLAILGVLGLVTWWVVRLGVRPVLQMTEAAEAIAAGDLSRRVPVGAPGTEAGALGAALNGMLGRIEEAFHQRAASEDRLRQFVADASHELRTPVTTIRGYAELYRSGGLTEGDDLREAMRRTEQEAVRMGTLVDDLLRLARLDEGRPLTLTALDLVSLCADVVRDASATAPQRSISLSGTGPVALQGDEDALRQVVTNLVQNALVHAPGAAVGVRIRTAGARAILEVADDGPGMAPDDAARAFERFHRADPSRSRRHGGAGLGLAIVDAIVRAHDGTVTLTTEPGRGTTVTVELPTELSSSRAPVA